MLAVAIVFLCLNLFVPYYDDDIWYALRYIPNETLSPITRFSDILVSQYHHYMGENSRALVHITLQSLLVILPDWGFDLLNTLVFLLLIWCVTRYTQYNTRSIQPLALLLTIAGIYWLLPDMDYLFYWAAGSLNYMWTSTATILFLLLWQRTIQAEKRVDRYTYLYVAAIFCCASLHEAFALPIGGAILLYMLTHYRNIGYNTTTLYAIAYGLGCIAILAAPGLGNKAANIGYASFGDYISSFIISIRTLRVIPICIAVAVISMCRRSWRNTLSVFIKENYFLILITLISFVFVFAIRAGAYTMRIFYATEFFALMLLLRYLNKAIFTLSGKAKRAITITMAIVLVGWVALVLPPCYHTGRQHYALIEAHHSDSDGVIFLPQESTPSAATPWVMDLNQLYYLSPEAEWRAFVTPLTHLQDTLKVGMPIMQRNADHSYRLYNRYLQMIPQELEEAIETPHEFFTPQNKIAGNNPFYGIAGGDYIIAHIDSTSTDDKWYWHYHPVSWREPSASIVGFMRRVVAPNTFPLSEPMLYPDTVTLTSQTRYIIYARPQYRSVKGIERGNELP